MQSEFLQAPMNSHEFGAHASLPVNSSPKSGRNHLRQNPSNPSDLPKLLLLGGGPKFVFSGLYVSFRGAIVHGQSSLKHGRRHTLLFPCCPHAVFAVLEFFFTHHGVGVRLCCPIAVSILLQNLCWNLVMTTSASCRGCRSLPFRIVQV